MFASILRVLSFVLSFLETRKIKNEVYKQQEIEALTKEVEFRKKELERKNAEETPDVRKSRVLGRLRNSRKG